MKSTQSEYLTFMQGTPENSRTNCLMTTTKAAEGYTKDDMHIQMVVCGHIVSTYI